MKIHALPGVFSHNELDIGSDLLLSTLTEPMSGNVLDLACGNGVLAAVVGTQNPAVTLTLSDVSASAIDSATATLAANNLTGKIIPSDVYSDLDDKFDWIISNPPFHDGINTSYNAVETLIFQAPKYLKKVVVYASSPMHFYLTLIYSIKHSVVMLYWLKQGNLKFTKQLSAKATSTLSV